jgi:hypothetical protein
MRYGFELDRAAEAGGVRRRFSYSSVFDGQRSTVRVSPMLESPPASQIQTPGSLDAQNLDVRAILLAFRPLDSAMGHLLLDRAVTNNGRTFHRGRSIFLLEERHDASGWKTILWIEPERDFLVSRIIIAFEQEWIADIDIDYRQDGRAGWIPSGWRVTEMSADGARRLVSTAAVASYRIN